MRGFLVESEPPARFRQHRQLASTPGTPIPQTTLTPGFHAIWTAKSVISGSTSSVPNISAGTFINFEEKFLLSLFGPARLLIL